MKLEENKIDQALKACKRAFNYIIFFGFIASFLTLATSIYSLEVFDRVLPKYLECFNKAYREGKWLVGDNITIADFAIG